MQPHRTPAWKAPAHSRRLRLARHRLAVQGFTLVEVMVVVVLVGILATIGIVSLRKWMVTSKAVEALHVIQGIRGAQERYRAEGLVYLDVSTSGTLYPMTTPGTKKYNWVQTTHVDYPRWRLLNPTVSTSVQHGYIVRAGRAMTAPYTPPGMTITWPAAAEIQDPWYVIYAQGDLNGDGVPGRYAASSLTGEIARINDGG